MSDKIPLASEINASMKSAMDAAALSQTNTDNAQNQSILQNSNADAQEAAARKSADATLQGKLDTLPKGISCGSGTIPVMSVAASQAIVINFNRNQPSTNYRVSYDVFGVGLGSIKVMVQDKAIDKVTLSISAVVAITAAGTIDVMATSKDY